MSAVVFLIAVAHGIPIMVAALVSRKRQTVKVTALVMCVIAFVTGSSTYVLVDLLAIGVAYAISIKFEQRTELEVVLGELTRFSQSMNAILDWDYANSAVVAFAPSESLWAASDTHDIKADWQEGDDDSCQAALQTLMHKLEMGITPCEEEHCPECAPSRRSRERLQNFIETSRNIWKS